MNQTHPNPEGNRARDQAGCRQPPRLPVPPAAAPYTHPVYGTQQVQQYPFPQTAPGTTGHLPPKKRPGWRIAVGVALALVALLVLVAAITGGPRGGAAINTTDTKHRLDPSRLCWRLHSWRPVGVHLPYGPFCWR
jgi:hypothetical protein